MVQIVIRVPSFIVQASYHLYAAAGVLCSAAANVGHESVAPLFPWFAGFVGPSVWGVYIYIYGL